MVQSKHDIDKLLATVQKAKNKRKKLNYCVEIPEELFEKIDQHVRVLQTLGSEKFSKNMWIEDSIVNFLQTPIDMTKRVKYLNVSFEKILHGQLDDIVATAREIGNPITKKDLIIDAIQAKMKKENKKKLLFLKKARIQTSTKK